MKFVHMKTPLQNWNVSTESWQSNVLSNFNGILTVGNIRQHKIFHYIEKDFLSDYIVDKLQELSRG